MDAVKQSGWISHLALALAATLALDHLLDGWLAKFAWGPRAAVLFAALALAVAAVALVFARVLRQERGARRYLDLMSRLDYRGAGQEIPRHLLGGIDTNSPWIGVINRLREQLSGNGQRVDQLEQVRAALEVRARRYEAKCEQMAAILATLPEPVIAINGFDEVVLANQSAEQVLGIDAGSEKRALANLVRCEKLVALLTETRRRRLSTQRTCEVELPDETGAPRAYNVLARNMPAETEPGPTGEGGSQGAVAVLQDVSLQKAAQRRNAEFVSAVSHEMKTPLAGIKAYVELLADGDAEDEQAREEFLEVINGQADRLQRLVDNLLNLARIEAGVAAVSKQNRALNELLEEALRVVQPSAEAKQIELAGDLSPLYLGVRVDRDMLLQAAINLLSNAIKYTPPGGKVALRSRLCGSEVRFEVEDTGVGLSPEDCSKVFEKFYRVQKSKEMAAGTGLGLPLAKHIVEDVHGGKLTVESELGRGSKFIVTLPGTGQAS